MTGWPPRLQKPFNSEAALAELKPLLNDNSAQYFRQTYINIVGQVALLGKTSTAKTRLVRVKRLTGTQFLAQIRSMIAAAAVGIEPHMRETMNADRSAGEPEALRRAQTEFLVRHRSFDFVDRKAIESMLHWAWCALTCYSLDCWDNFEYIADQVHRQILKEVDESILAEMPPYVREKTKLTD